MDTVYFKLAEGVSCVTTHAAGSFDPITVEAGQVFASADPEVIRALDGVPSVERADAPETPEPEDV